MLKIKKSKISPLERFLDEPVVRDIEQFRRDIRSNKCEFSDDLDKFKDLNLLPSSSAGGGRSGDKGGRDAQKFISEGLKSAEVSVVWRHKVKGKNIVQKRDWTDGVSMQDKVAFTESILRYQNDQSNKQRKAEIAYTHELETAIQLDIARKKEDLKKDKEIRAYKRNESIALSLKYGEEKKIKDKLRRKIEKDERLRIKSEINDSREHYAVIKAEGLEKQRVKDLNYKRIILLEKEQIKMVLDKSNLDENIRRLAEEKRMKYLEEKRKIIEDKNEQIKKEKEIIYIQKKKETRQLVNEATNSIRMGAFAWHNGVYGFYKDIRAGPVPWVLFMDYEGVPIYFDPIYNKSQRRKPENVQIDIASDDDVRTYDVINGAGAYDAYFADILFKDKYNSEGGYYDDTSTWIVATGYYDENYEFVQHNGFYNEKGKYILYPKPKGDLSFMV
eukprot:CAMPEP_0119053802 /NCGR_PEP_ID=MMETSP1177-20130426/74659_1 /TAXON_ID=2985 /ORGANISM="Ochromonas sp, Strain CCMP1899" /LENGTH=443 /DNA_ID=CAMNT_0007033853 /DNA_START=2225 /DNA_END=3556 /DNA_ORIENTATION=-